jgi:hypothetical protein
MQRLDPMCCSGSRVGCVLALCATVCNAPRLWRGHVRCRPRRRSLASGDFLIVIR